MISRTISEGFYKILGYLSNLHVIEKLIFARSCQTRLLILLVALAVDAVAAVAAASSFSLESRYFDR